MRPMTGLHQGCIDGTACALAPSGTQAMTCVWHAAVWITGSNMMRPSVIRICTRAGWWPAWLEPSLGAITGSNHWEQSLATASCGPFCLTSDCTNSNSCRTHSQRLTGMVCPRYGVSLDGRRDGDRHSTSHSATHPSPAPEHDTLPAHWLDPTPRVTQSQWIGANRRFGIWIDSISVALHLALIHRFDGLALQRCGWTERAVANGKRCQCLPVSDTASATWRSATSTYWSAAGSTGRERAEGVNQDTSCQ